jgi:chemotaxis protein methyltransferase CheR
MKDDACVHFLQWALPYLHMYWPGFRKVRGQVCKRLSRRLEELQLHDLGEYRTYLENNPLEFHTLDSLCRITISRFFRDRGVYQLLQTKIFPELISLARRRQENSIYCWSIGAASGEEPYSLSLLWEMSDLKTQGIDLRILATEVDQQMINRARKGCYPASSIRELPETSKNRAFIFKDKLFCLKENYKKRVQFLQQDIRINQPAGPFHIILCRNLIFTYYAKNLQNEIGQNLVNRLQTGGFLVIGTHEKLPDSLFGLSPVVPGEKIFSKES